MSNKKVSLFRISRGWGAYGRQVKRSERDASEPLSTICSPTTGNAKEPKVLFILFNDFTNDSRVLKEATSLVNNNYIVTIFCQIGLGLPLIEYINGIKVIRNFDCHYKIVQPTYSSEIESAANKFDSSVNKTGSIREYVREILYRFKTIIKKIPLIKSIVKLLLNVILLKRQFGVVKHLSSNFKDVDIIQCHDLIALPYGIALKLLSIKRPKILIYDAHEYETEVGFSVVGFKKKQYELKERICIKFADHVITVSDSIADAYKNKYNLDKTPTVLLNCPRYNQIFNKSTVFRDKFNIPDNKIIFIYQGGFCEHRGLNLIIAAFRELKGADKVVVFMGDGIFTEIIKKEAEINENVYYQPTVPPDEILDYTSSADVGLCLYENICLNHYYCLPNKMFEYSMAGLPVIVSNLYELGKSINTYNNGLIISEYSKDGLIKSIENINIDTLKDKLINNHIFNIEYNWEAQEKKLLSIYDNYLEVKHAFDIN